MHSRVFGAWICDELGIVITACELSADESHFLHAGVHGVLPKGSYSQTVLLNEVRAFLEAAASNTGRRRAG